MIACSAVTVAPCREETLGSRVRSPEVLDVPGDADLGRVSCFDRGTTWPWLRDGQARNMKQSPLGDAKAGPRCDKESKLPMSQVFDLPPASAADQAGFLDDKDIRTTLTRMAWCEDRHDWGGLDQVLDDAVETEYVSFGSGSVVLSRAEFVANWRGGLEGTASQHILTGIDVDVDGDTAE